MKYIKTRRAVIILFWIGIWFLAARAVDNKILLATPLETARRLFALLGEGQFYQAAGGSLLRIGTGLLAGFLVGALLAGGSLRFSFLEELLAPVISLTKTVPVASFVILLLIWWGSSFLVVAICFLVVFPGIYLSTLEGLKSMDSQLLEMAKVFRLPFWNRFFYIYCPGLRPFLYGSLKASLGMCWKAGVAAEVIGVPDASIGEGLYLSKVYLDTAGVFAWTAAVVLLSILMEKLVLRLIGLFFRWEPACRGQLPFAASDKAGGDLEIRDIVKSYQGKNVLDGISQIYRSGQVYYLTSPSGSGKTTLLYILAGLAEADSGKKAVPGACSMVFQEDRLCEEYSAVRNVELVTGDRRRAEEALGMLLEKEALHKPCSQLSGGMKRRVALVRAMEAESAFVLLDEPFTGMDAATRRFAEEYIGRSQRGRILIIASHI